MTSSTVLNTELTAIRAIIPAERASVHWLYSERLCNGVCEFMCLGRLTVRVESCCIVQIMKFDLWPLTFSLEWPLTFQSMWAVRSGEQSCMILPICRKNIRKTIRETYIFTKETVKVSYECQHWHWHVTCLSHYNSLLLSSRANSGQLYLNLKMPVTKQHIMIPAATAPIVAVAMEIRFKSFRSQDGAPWIKKPFWTSSHISGFTFTPTTA